MRCTDKTFRRKRNRKKQLYIRIISIFFLCIVVALGIILLLNNTGKIRKYEILAYSDSVYKAELFAEDLCVINEEVEFEEFYRHDEFHGALLFDLEDREVLYAEQVHQKLYPASTTKLLTAYLALKYGDMDETVTVSKNAVSVPSDSSKEGLKEGDKLTLLDLIYSLMLPSGNDSGVAIAEHICGTVEEFMELMNEEANALGATNTHFVNPHGYHDDNHYTTAYDLYLIFRECIKDERFIQIISTKQYNAVITEKSGTQRQVTWWQSNKFINGAREVPSGITMIGGKTGTTFEAGSCLVMYGITEDEKPYISVMMGATSSRNLYDNMTFLWSAIPNEK